MIGYRFRVLHVVSGDLWAGAEAQVAALVAELARDPQVQLHAVVLNPGELERRLRAAGVGVTVVDESQLGVWRILRGIRAVVRDFRPDVIHTHREKENVLGGLAARLAGRASMRTVHGASEHRAPAWRIDKQAIRWLDRFAERHWQQASVAVSDELGQRLRTERPGITVEVIHNGIDRNSLAALREHHFVRGVEQRPKRVAFLGRLVPVKRVDLFLEMARECLDGGGEELTFDVVGEGPMAAELRSLADRLRLQDWVTLHGFRPDALALLADVDALVFTSDHEGTPMAALEAIAIGVPVVARAVGGLPELLSGVTGCRLVEGGEPTAFAAAVRAVLEAGEHPQLPERYNIRRCAALYRELYAGAAHSATPA
jgi:glycosyltransferase involved in cell wall biosynthesis